MSEWLKLFPVTFPFFTHSCIYQPWNYNKKLVSLFIHLFTLVRVSKVLCCSMMTSESVNFLSITFPSVSHSCIFQPENYNKLLIFSFIHPFIQGSIPKAICYVLWVMSLWVRLLSVTFLFFQSFLHFQPWNYNKGVVSSFVHPFTSVCIPEASCYVLWVMNAWVKLLSAAFPSIRLSYIFSHRTTIRASNALLYIHLLHQYPKSLMFCVLDDEGMGEIPFCNFPFIIYSCIFSAMELK